jgi:Ni,Fe-hydrogenase III small subunit
LEDKNIHVGIGKYLKTCPKGTIFIGNCTSKIKAMGIFIQGCPPVASDILEALEGKEDLERDGGLNHPMSVSYGIDDKK